MTETWRCPYCGYEPVTIMQQELHEEGVDAANLYCPHQDIEAIKQRERPSRPLPPVNAPW